MRITGGDKKGCILISPKNNKIRPSSDHIREVIFNIIGHNLSNKKVLDLFAGTGALGLEALSRGAEYVCFVDKSIESLNIIKRNLEITGYKNRASLIRKDLSKSFLKFKKRFDIVFIDPPYDSGLLAKIFNTLPVKDILEEKAVIVARSSKREVIPVYINYMRLKDLRHYGDTRLWIYNYCKEEEK